MIRTGAFLLGLLAASTALAQQAPFDMSGERGATREEKAAPATGETQTTVPLTPEPAATAAEGRRYIIPAESLLLEGEVARRAFTVFLTPSQAEKARRINIGYSNAVVVAPEVSSLTVIVNDRQVGTVAVRSADGTTDVSFDLPAGLMRAGLNRVTFAASHRHRTDCTIRSTYDLWTSLDPSRVYLSIDPEDDGRLPTTDDISAIGPGPTGKTKFTLVVPKMDQPAATRALMRLSQGLSLLAGMPNQSFDIVRELPAETGPGEMTVAVGTAADLAALLPGLPAGTGSTATAAFAERGPGKGRVFVIGGPDWAAVEEAVEGIVSPTGRTNGEALSIHRRNAEDVPLLTGEATLTFSQLGLRTGEFTGRRLRTGFFVGIPSDFYADAYGEATILLDAAYSAEVLPGSQINIHVNGNLASTVPITTRNGGFFRHLPIRVTMRHFRPGPNRIVVEASLLTESDRVCAPGATASGEPRFALFDTSEFHMPRFARIAQLPDLAALSGTGFPYSRQEEPVALFLDRLDGDTLSASATFLGKLAVASGRALALEPEASALSIGDRDAILVGAISQLPLPVLAQAHLSPESASGWGGPVRDPGEGAETETAMDAWQSRVRDSLWRRVVSGVEGWLDTRFDISFSSVRLFPGSEVAVTPPDTARFLVAQGDSPGGDATWTVLSAPTGADLRAGMAAMAEDIRWQKLDGYASLEEKGAEQLETHAVSRMRFVPTQPLSLDNLRLIAANWLSSNILAYAAAFCLLAVLLGLATSRLLGSFGRRD